MGDDAAQHRGLVTREHFALERGAIHVRGLRDRPGLHVSAGAAG